ncbi:MAG: aminoacyl-tRNA hydrolase [bacterium]
MKLIVGLGNPGKLYTLTRHNMGHMVCKAVAETLSVKLNRKKHHTLFGRIIRENIDVVLCLPQTFMNESGRSIISLMAFFKVAPVNLLVICDDINLTFGQLRFRPKGSHGGHNGLRSIIQHIGGDFPRLRIGIGMPDNGGFSDYVLSRFNKNEQKQLSELINRSEEAVRFFIEKGMDAAMCTYNTRGQKF